MNISIPSDPRILFWGWIGLAAAALLLVGMTVVWLPRTGQTGRAVKEDRRKLDQQVQELDEQIQRDQTLYVSHLKRFPWLLDGTGGTGFLTRLSGLASGQRLGISGVGPLERKKMGQVERVGRKVTVVSSFSDIVALVENTERNLGFIEGFKAEPLDPRSRPKELGDLEAQFNMVTVELNPDIRQRWRSLMASAPAPAKSTESERPLASPSKVEAGSKSAPLRNPFRAAASSIATGKPAAGARDGEWSVFRDLKFSGIVSLPDNIKVAIINDRMTREGDRIGQVLVQRITDSEVVLKSGPEVKHIKLRAFASTIPGQE